MREYAILAVRQYEYKQAAVAKIIVHNLTECYSPVHDMNITDLQRTAVNDCKNKVTISFPYNMPPICIYEWCHTRRYNWSLWSMECDVPYTIVVGVERAV
jgi:hypothetical protein